MFFMEKTSRCSEKAVTSGSPRRHIIAFSDAECHLCKRRHNVHLKIRIKLKCTLLYYIIVSDNALSMSLQVMQYY